MKIVLRRFINVFFLVLGIAGSFAAQAAYLFTTIDYPGAVATQCFGINNAGQVVCGAAFADGSGNSFLYDSKKGTMTTLPVTPGEVGPSDFGTGFLGINEPGVLVGSTSFDGVTNVGVILGKKNTFTTFSQPGRTYTVPRAVGTSGLVTGFTVNDDGSDWSGFIYDPKYNSYIDFLHSPQTIAQGINGRGDVVGGVFLSPNGAYLGSPQGQYGFLRDKFGTITLFRVNSSRTRGRGITDSGQIVGFISTPAGNASGYVGTLAGLPGPGQNIPDAVLLDAPGALNTYAQGISNSGMIVGSWDDGAVSHGFIAKPTK
jgi:hypothetical protein